MNPPDLGCKNWDWDNKVCLGCSTNWVQINNICIPVSDQCKTFDSDNGNCLSCYRGYNLEFGNCIIQDLTLVINPDKGCNDWNWNDRICLSCSHMWYFNEQGKCAPVSDLCKSADPNGNCLTCYKGYKLVNGKCENEEIIKPTDVGCGKWDWDNQVCLECSKDWVFNNDKVCVPVSDQCREHAANGACTSCYKGYHIENGACVIDAVVKPSDSGCGKWDWDNQVCLECSYRWTFNSNNKCVPVDDFCSSYDKSSGSCTACYAGYILSNGSCNLGNPLCKTSTADGAC